MGTTITATQWNNLRSDIRKVKAHQAGGSNAVALTTVDVDTGITADIHNEFETALAQDSPPDLYWQLICKSAQLPIPGHYNKLERNSNT